MSLFTFPHFRVSGEIWYNKLQINLSEKETFWMKMCLDLRQKKQSNKETVHLMEPPAKILSRFVEIWTLKGVGERRGTQGCLSPFSFPPPLPSPFPFSSFSLSVSSSLPFSPFSLPSLSLPPTFSPFSLQLTPSSSHFLLSPSPFSPSPFPLSPLVPLSPSPPFSALSLSPPVPLAERGKLQLFRLLVW